MDAPTRPEREGSDARQAIDSLYADETPLLVGRHARPDASIPSPYDATQMVAGSEQVAAEGVPFEDQEGARRSSGRGFLRFIVTIIAVIVFAFLLRTFVFQSYEIPSGSMEDTIMPGDLVFAEKVTTYFEVPDAGSIVTFADPETADAPDPQDRRTLIKRVIATGGQTVNLIDGDVYIDGVKQDEPYTDGKPTYPLNTPGSVGIDYPYLIPDGYLWMMGDNRTSSQDSRYFGAVPESSVQGHALFKYWPLSDAGPL